MARILLVEDDRELAALTAEFLRASGHEVTADDGLTPVDALLADRPDLLLLDVELPGASGFAMCKVARERGYQGPVLFLTARGTDFDERLAFEMGGDDFMRKPVDPRVLVLRIEAALRSRGASHVWRDGALTIDPHGRQALQDGVALALTSGQFDLLWLLAQTVGQVVTRETYYREIRGIAYDGVDRTYDSRIMELRSLLAAAGCAHRIVTVRGEGYQLAPQSGSDAPS